MPNLVALVVNTTTLGGGGGSRLRFLGGGGGGAIFSAFRAPHGGGDVLLLLRRRRRLWFPRSGRRQRRSPTADTIEVEKGAASARRTHCGAANQKNVYRVSSRYDLLETGDFPGDEKMGMGGHGG